MLSLNYKSIAQPIFFNLIEISIILAILLITNLAIVRLTKFFIKKQNKRSYFTWNIAVIESLKNPTILILWIFGLLLILRIINQELWYQVNHLITNLFSTISILWFLFKLLRKYENYCIIKDREKKKNSYSSAILTATRLAKILLLVIAFIIMLEAIGIDIKLLLTFGGIGGIALGFAAKDTLSNILGAATIYLDRIFFVGDWIRSPDREIEGTVESIGWRLTQIRTFNTRLLYIPNSIFNNIILENVSRMSNRRIYENIRLRYQDVTNVNKVTEDVKKFLEKNEYIDNSLSTIVNLNHFEEYSADFFVYTYTHTTDWIEFHKIKQKILLEISNIIKSNNCEIAFPTSLISINNDAYKEQ